MLGELLQPGGVSLLIASYGSLLAVACAELLLERRPPAHSSLRRWSANLGLGLIDRGVVAWLLPMGVLSASLWAAERGLGILPAAGLAPLPAALAAFVLIDLAAWALHRAQHAVPVLWRLHRVHHADLEVDFSTAQRHHPLAALVATGVGVGCVVAIGAPPAAVVAYYLLLAPVGAVAHGNLRLPHALDRAVRWLVITPGMHVVHHSAIREETDSNFGELLSAWDRLFGTYREAPALGEAGMTIGLEGFRETRDLDLDRLLVQPLREEGVAAPAPA